MLQEAIKTLFAESANRVRQQTLADWKFDPIEIPGADPNALFYVSAEGQLESVHIKTANRRVQIDTIRGFAEYVSMYATEDACEVYVGSAAVRAFLSGLAEYDVAAMPLMQTAEFVELLKACEPKSLDQAAFLQWLKISLGGRRAGEEVAALINAVAKLRFSHNSEGRSDLSNSGADVGRSTVARLAGAGDVELPETFMAAVPVYALPEAGEVSRAVRVHLGVDVMGQRFFVQVDRTSVREAELSVRQMLVDRLRDATQLDRVHLGDLLDA